MRKVMAILAACGLTVSVCIFVKSFFGLTMDKLAAKAFLLHVGIFVLAIPLAAVEGRPKRLDPFRGKPTWVLRSIQLLFLLSVVVFFTLLALSHAASPKIVNGEYVLSNHGRMVGNISESDYLFLKAWGLRLFASGWIVFYYALATNWWFPRQNERAVVRQD